MKSTGQKLILLSFVLALIASAVLFLYLQSLKSPKEQVKKTTVLVAAETIPARTLIEKKMVKEIETSDSTIFSEYIKDSSQIVGKYTKESILKDEGFREAKLISSESSELALKLDGDHRAISINVTGDAGVSDLLKPGDFVDVIVYVAEKKDGAKVISPEIAKIILQNIEVLAVDKQLDRENNLNDKASDNENRLTNFLVTLSVTASDTEKLVLAESVGTLKLTLRPLKDADSKDTSGATLKELTVNTETEAENNATSENTSSNSKDEKYKYYKVKRGDTLKKISQAFYGTPYKYKVIEEANKMKNGNLIVTGEVIRVPILN